METLNLNKNIDYTLTCSRSFVMIVLCLFRNECSHYARRFSVAALLLSSLCVIILFSLSKVSLTSLVIFPAEIYNGNHILYVDTNHRFRL